MNNSSTGSSNSKCSMIIVQTDAWTLFHNTLKIVLLILYTTWILIAIKVKEFHKKSMVYMFNLNIVSLSYAAYSFGFLFISSCFTSMALCELQQVIAYYWPILPGYALAGLALYRLACVYSVNLKNKLNKTTIIVSIAIIWIVPALEALAVGYVFSTGVEYIESIKSCTLNLHMNTKFFLFFALVAQGIPSIVVFFAYIAVVIKIRILKKRLNANNYVEPPRINILLIIYIIMYHMSNAGSLIQIYTASYDPSTLTVGLFWTGRMIKIFQHFCPIVILYTNPLMVKRFKISWNRMRSFLFCTKTYEDNAVSGSRKNYS